MNRAKYEAFAAWLLGTVDDQLAGAVEVVRQRLSAEREEQLSDMDLLGMLIGAGIASYVDDPYDGTLWRVFQKAEAEGKLSPEKPCLFLVK